jgi:ABC-type Co2+ transport system permease subunit
VSNGEVPSDSDYAPNALPSVGARVLGFVAILIAGLCGGVIGYAFTDLQCSGDCTVQRGIGALVGAVVGAAGVAVVVTLALRAMGEWRTIQHREGE